MFTGLIEACVPILEFEPRGTGARMVVGGPTAELEDPWRPVLGESVATSGCCLTVVEFGPSGELTYDLSAETLEKTWFGPESVGKRVNLERSLRLGARLGGHLVSGHVDSLGRVVGIEDRGDGGTWMRFEGPAGFGRWLVDKGSVAVDGISLTVVEPEGDRFSVALIPETLARTNLGVAQIGTPLHLEADQLGKWVAHLVAPWRPPQ